MPIAESRRQEREMAEEINKAAEEKMNAIRPYVDYLLMLSGEDPVEEVEESAEENHVEE